jgi:hypothetical protein
MLNLAPALILGNGDFKYFIGCGFGIPISRNFVGYTRQDNEKLISPSRIDEIQETRGIVFDLRAGFSLPLPIQRFYLTGVVESTLSGIETSDRFLNNTGKPYQYYLLGASIGISYLIQL